MKKISFFIALFFTCLFLTSCLTVEKKDYTWTMGSKGGGELTINFYNIMSAKEEENDVSQQDFDELINNYYKGFKAQDEYPNARLIKKEIYEQGGVLCARVVYKFSKWEDVKLYQYQDKGPIMLCLSTLSEVFDNSNGDYGGETMPVLFWKRAKKMTLSTKIEDPTDKDISLLARWKEYSQKNVPYKAN